MDYQPQGFWSRVLKGIVAPNPAIEDDHEWPVVEVEWVDSVGDGGWQERNALAANPHICHTIGWLIEEGPKAILLAGSYGPKQGHVPEQFSGTMVIPKCAILSRRELPARYAVGGRELPARYIVGGRVEG